MRKTTRILSAALTMFMLSLSTTACFGRFAKIGAIEPLGASDLQL